MRSTRTKRLLGHTLSILFIVPAALGSQRAPEESNVTALIEHAKRDLDQYHFRDAEQSLREAVKLDPGSATAHNLLARALVGQLPRNLQLFPDVEHLLPLAESEARKALDSKSDDASAWCTMGIIQSKLADIATQPSQRADRLNEADHAFKQALTIDPNSYEAHYELGKMALNMALQPLLLARAKSGVPIGQPGRIRDPGILRMVQSRYNTQIDAGIHQTQQALSTTPNSRRAMRQMAGLLQERSLLQDTEQAYEGDLDAAREWSRKADAEAAAAAAHAPPAAIPETAYIGGTIGAILSGADPQPTSLLLLPQAAEKRLIKKVDPVLPASAGRAGIVPDVAFRAIIDKQGRVRSAQWIDGNRELESSARDALRQWEYQPLLVDGQPQEFVTTIRVHFAFSQ